MLSASEKKSVEDLLRIFHELEQTAQDGDFSPSLLQNLKEKLKNFASSDQPDLKRLAEIEKHLLPSMSLKHFVAFMVPVERLLSRAVQDDDFLVRENDLKAKTTEALPLVFVLDNIRSAFNVGSCLRTGECLHIEKVYLCGYTPVPTQDKVRKTALGTEELMAWEERSQILELLRELKAKNYHLVALETAEKASSLYESFPQDRPTAFIVGNERFGLEAEVLRECHEIRAIPLRGQKNSLNVGVSLAVAAFEWNRQRDQA